MFVNAYGAHAGDQPLEPMRIVRRTLGPHDVRIDIAYCGICHSDLHQARGEWAGTRFPCVPGHEIVGRVAAVGAHVAGMRPGDLVGVGCIVDSCRHCAECEGGLENYCDGMVGTYNFPSADAPGHTLGGYSQQIVVHQRYVLRISHPAGQLAAVAPLLCAGITTYSPLRHWGAGPGKTVGVVGIGGLGHVGVKLAHAMGARVVAFTTAEAKREAALALGADAVVVSRNAQEMAAHAGSIDLIVDTVAAAHDLDAFLGLLKRDGAMVLVGAPASPHPSPAVFSLIMRRRTLAGSMIGGIAETQEMLDFCAEHGIVADIELIRAEQINAAYERMLQGDVKYRFVIDNATLAA
ncbi:NAD(P)-dependent alcohol dehydrogenase [Xanthomonas rydalmerensis]|uniref:NAD(P)-dependent alcohol dehydrogenase n=1 Tax=Xanthomonas rydalmerensis TaxID=3046274 RepID=A0ABZ0JI56_9XANT|nr:NAD(P)-dependent alcohol dehydrogenase [Xanthomonas sp. DM-2023]WOS39305.1 NAD(P)-dependent alcohol dehydrogenase [Xanthomonas sp. DM-2023]WOS43489.1 NAD(P)-dependent alcohol dehydrogenase [Xanthomonas sp. DM-2023]WOS47670.1 NAD(P)-dependent alcohol dehydrogenase [Xanthomonas sp. DM-2023]WOS51848.1 NAD(P)-dependent alcohol dehydrogenase [Xanthomonas sp. DM-2023]WOS56032.1 NAD(P)-dependent alcohol dehydrogenase [Xanthomonas sp. DM-2023]